MVDIAQIIKYEGDNTTFIWKSPIEDFNTQTPLIVWLFVSYKENGVLTRVEIPEITDMATVFEIPDVFKDCDITVYVWDKNMRPLMDKQEIEK